MIKDVDSVEQLVDKALELINDADALNELSNNILKMAEKDSADRIAEEVIKLIN